MAVGIADAAGIEPRRSLVLLDRPIVVGLIALTLNHGLFAVRAASTLADAEEILVDWRPHIGVVDMERVGWVTGTSVPVTVPPSVASI